MDKQREEYRKRNEKEKEEREEKKRVDKEQRRIENMRRRKEKRAEKEQRYQERRERKREENRQRVMEKRKCFGCCHIQVHLSRNNITMVKPPLNHTSLSSMVATFLTTCLIAVLQSSRYSIFHDGVTPVSVETLKPPLGAIEVLPLKPQASPIILVCI